MEVVEHMQLTLIHKSMIDKKLKKEAIKLGLCDEWQAKWSETGLIEKYLLGITWAMEREYPSYQLMDKMKEACNRNGIYNRENLNIKCDRETYIFNGCDVDFEIDGYNVCRIYAGRGSKVRIHAKDSSIVYIDNYDSNVIINIDKGATVREWRYK